MVGTQGERTDAVIARIAARCHGAVAREQLLAAGITGRMVGHRVRSGVLVPVFRGVYLVAYGPRAPLAHEAAAVLACRPRAMLSHRTAGRLWRLPVPTDSAIDVTVVGRSRGPLPDLRLHALDRLAPSELRRYEGIPLTSPSLTLLDLAGVLGRGELESALHEARVQRLVTDGTLRATLDAHPLRTGARALRRQLEREGGIRMTRSEGERRLLRLLRTHGMEPDASDVRVGPYVLDFYYRAEPMAIEYDGRQFHDNPRRFARDRRKIAYLAARGILTVPLTAHDLGAGAPRAMADLRSALAARR